MVLSDFGLDNFGRFARKAVLGHNPFAFSRRYFMTNGSVVTNPGKLNPDVVRPEGIVDREIGVLAIRQRSGIVGLLANICNHADTVSGSRISADWPGFMERRLRELLGC
jgi:hypothetical protein